MGITYEELFEILRRERNSDELQVLDKGFYSALVSYFQDKEKVLKDTGEAAEIFGGSEKDSVRTQLQNARKISKELVERREKKIIILALNRARTNSDMIDTTALQGVEEELFHKASEILAEYRKGVVEKMLLMETPVFGNAKSEPAPEVELETTVEPEPVVEPVVEPKIEAEPVETAVEEPETAVEPAVATVSTKVKFLQPVPKFLGKDAETYGPYEAGEEAELDPDLATILVSKGRAEETDR